MICCRNKCRTSAHWFVSKIAIQSVHLVKVEATVAQPDPVMWYGYYYKKYRLKQ